MRKCVLVVATSDIGADEIRRPLDARFGGSAELEFVERDKVGAVRAIDEALRRRQVEEVVVVTRRSDERSWRESGAVESARDRFDVPISHLLVA